MLWVSILTLSTILIFDVGIGPTARYFFFFIFIRNVHSAKKETHKGILGILIQTFSVILLDIDSECLLLQN